ncbi:HAD family hydrolase [Pontibacter chinhatensis]|uniref:phosphoglycolate phosphatase n=1 Tax=Pontibacter chinhatensis TaxID=1436961 RepID=A0A1I2QWL4_9BACT|nr:HAD family hydrolase [Pontibacter chinhatensis]SFG32083.1 phosphoglycolate phosphatase [Pontibacter chinhatensis]
MPYTRYDGLIFDLDGTLWDSTQTIADAWNDASSQFDFVDLQLTRQDIRNIAGMPYDEIYHKLFPDLNLEQREQLQHTAARLELAYLQERGGELYPQLQETLELLQPTYNLFIVSNCQSGYIETFLQYYDLQSYFTDIACYGDQSLPKSENIRAVVQRHNLQRPVYIGDTQGDYAASVQAGVPFMLARYGFGKVQAEVPSIDALTELQELV